MLAKSKLNSIESKTSKAMMDNEISHEDFETIINEEKKYRELKEEGKKLGINEVIKRNEIINKSSKQEIHARTYKNEIILFKVQKRY